MKMSFVLSKAKVYDMVEETKNTTTDQRPKVVYVKRCASLATNQ